MTSWTPAPARTRYNRTYEFTTNVGDQTVTRTLDDLIGLDTMPVEVNADGTITERRDLYTPEVYANTTDDGESYLPDAEADAHATLNREGWEPMRGYTGQHGAGADAWFMHASEFIGGGLARDILATPGVYAAVVIYPLAAEGVEVEPTEWAVIRRTR